MARSDPFIQKISWGDYQSWSGPFFRGSIRYEVPSSPTWEQKLLAVTTATEGGAYDAVNCYDRCILSVGLIQWCEAASVFGVSRLLGRCAEADYSLVGDYVAELPVPRLTFRKTPAGVWRFCSNGTVYETKEQQRAIFLGGATGLAGQWNPIQKGHARRVAAVMASVWQEQIFREIQVAFTASRLISFSMPESKRLLFPAEGYDKDGWEGALRAGFISFAANLPAVADQYFRKAASSPEYAAASPKDRCILAFRSMTFGPGISIYPDRYNRIRPVLERLFGVDLPDFANDLQNFEDDKPWRHHYPDVRRIQQALITLGYDVGPAGADNVMGTKTKAAILKFEQTTGVPNPDGVPDDKFLEKLRSYHQQALERQENEKISRVVNIDELEPPDDG